MKKECSTCGGTGQVGFFQGVSRFLITWDECPQCNGTGQLAVDEEDNVPDKKQPRNFVKKKGSKKKSKRNK